MKPHHEYEQEGERGATPVEGSSSDRLGASAFPGREPGPAAAVVEARAPMADLAAWLDGLADEDDSVAVADEPEAAPRGCREAEELLLALAAVERPRPVTTALPVRATATPRLPVDSLARRFDARRLAERLLADSQQHAVLAADPFDLLAAQAGLDALSEDLLAQLLTGLAGAPTGDDMAAAVGAGERGLLALLALQLYVQGTKVRQERRPSETPLDPRHVALGERDERLLEVLAVPHAASRPLGERRPRGRPRR